MFEKRLCVSVSHLRQEASRASSHPHRIQKAETLPPISYVWFWEGHPSQSSHWDPTGCPTVLFVSCVYFCNTFSRLAEFPGMQIKVVKAKNEIDQQSWKSLKQRRFKPRAWSSWPCLTARLLHFTKPLHPPQIEG